MSNEQEGIDSTTDTQETVELVEESTESVPEIDVESLKKEIESLKKENATVKAQKDHWKKKVETNPVKSEEASEGSLSVKDALALNGAGITHDEDVEYIEKWARFNKVTVRDAIKDPFAIAYLKDLKEKRDTAAATQTRGGSRGAQKESPDMAIERAVSGQVPTDDAGIRALAEAEMARKKQALKR